MNNEESNVKSRGGKAPRKSMNVSMKEKDFDILVSKIRSIGLGTVGDLNHLIVQQEGAIEALRPFAQKYMKYLDKTPALSETALEKRLRVLKQLDPEKYKKILGSIEE